MNETKEAIQTAFLKIYKEKAFGRMSVKEVCLMAPVARTTFYEYYENLSDVKAEIEDTLVQGILDLAKEHQVSDQGQDPTVFFMDVMEYIRENWEANDAFLVSQPNLDYMEKWKTGIKYDFRLRFPEKVSLPEYDLVSEILASGVLSAYVYWMKHPDRMPAERILKLASEELKAITDLL